MPSAKCPPFLLRCPWVTGSYFSPRFGFLLNKPLSASYIDDSRPQYIHCTGGMFVLIPDNRTTSPRNLDGTHQKPVVGSYKDYILWQRAGMDASKEVGSLQGFEATPFNTLRPRQNGLNFVDPFSWMQMLEFQLKFKVSIVSLYQMYLKMEFSQRNSLLHVAK